MKRFRVQYSLPDGGSATLVEHPEGEFVTFKDHVEAIANIVRPLEWEDCFFGESKEASTPVGRYRVTRAMSGRFETCSPWQCHFEETEDAGLKWCEREYQQTIQAALAVAINPRANG